MSNFFIVLLLCNLLNLKLRLTLICLKMSQPENKSQMHDMGSQGDEVRSKDIDDSPKETFRAPPPGPQGDDTQQRSAPTFSSQVEDNAFETTEQPRPRGPGLLTLIGYLILRIVFILTATCILILAGLYTAKMSGIYDLCEKFHISTQECISTPHLKGLVYRIKCTETQQCLLPGFWSTTKKEDWSFKNSVSTPSNLMDNVEIRDEAVEAVIESDVSAETQISQ